MLAQLGAGYDSIKTAVGLVKALSAVNTQVQINEVKINLQRLMLDAQEALLAAQELQSTHCSRISQLENEIIRLQDWSQQKQRYELVNVRHGAIAYALKIGLEDGAPPHWLCANCFDKSRKSFLQHKGQNGPEAAYGCDAYQGSFRVPFRCNPEALARITSAA